MPEAGCEAVVVVTGASRGLGRALAESLLSRDYRVAACATTAPPVAAHLCRGLDVADAPAVQAFADEVVARLGPIDVWINNAAVIGPVGTVDNVEPAEWDECVQVNLMGTLHGSHAFLRRCSVGAVLINIASRAGMQGVAGLAAYSASKAAVIALTESIAAEERDDVSAFVVVPPSIDTDMQRRLLAEDESVFPGVNDSRRRRDAGAILEASEAASLILDAVVDSRPADTVVDLTER